MKNTYKLKLMSLEFKNKTLSLVLKLKNISNKIIKNINLILDLCVQLFYYTFNLFENFLQCNRCLKIMNNKVWLSF